MIILIGSGGLYAAHFLTSAALGRSPLDIDLICGIGDYERLVRSIPRDDRVACYPVDDGNKMIIKKRDGHVISHSITWPSRTAREFSRLVAADPKTKVVHHRDLGDVLVPSVDVLYALKLSHRFLKNSPHFHKTRRDIAIFERSGATLPTLYSDWFKKREEETYAYSHPNLNQSKGAFFSGDQINYIYDHDSIHVAMAIGEMPAYTLFKKDGSEVRVDKDKWAQLMQPQRLNSVVEEALVLALERSQIPFPGKLSPHQSFLKALEKICTSISSGWWRAYAYDNYDSAVGAFGLLELDRPYVDRFWAGVRSGQVKKVAQ